jgi:hypothetical protein
MKKLTNNACRGHQISEETSYRGNNLEQCIGSDKAKGPETPSTFCLYFSGSCISQLLWAISGHKWNIKVRHIIVLEFVTKRMPFHPFMNGSNKN